MYAVIGANETSNIHSLAVQMRPILECAGQIVFVFHNLLVAPKTTRKGLRRVGEYINADYFRSTINVTKGKIGKEQLRQTIIAASSNSGMSRKEALSGGNVRHMGRVDCLEGGKGWYRYLSNSFCKGKADWRGDSFLGGVSSARTIRDEFTCASLMDYLARQVAVMNVYATLCPTGGGQAHERIDTVVRKQFQNVHATTDALLKAVRTHVKNLKSQRQ